MYGQPCMRAGCVRVCVRVCVCVCACVCVRERERESDREREKESGIFLQNLILFRNLSYIHTCTH